MALFAKVDCILELSKLFTIHFWCFKRLLKNYEKNNIKKIFMFKYSRTCIAFGSMYAADFGLLIKALYGYVRTQYISS